MTSSIDQTGSGASAAPTVALVNGAATASPPFGLRPTGGYTPGPWVLGPSAVVLGADGRRVCQMAVRIDMTDVGDAHLIVAAPDMVKALDWYADQLCEGWCGQSPDCAHFEDCAGCLARRVAFQATGTAIAKAVQS